LKQELQVHPSDGIELIRKGCPVALPSGGGHEGRAEARSRGPLCPFGCEGVHIDDLGYCNHLQGFTDGRQEKDKQGNLVTVYEYTRKVKGKWVTGEMKQEQDGDFVQEYAVDRVLEPNDIVVHINNGRTGKAYAGTQWARVYRPRKPGEVPVFRAGTSQTPDLSQLQKVLTDHEKRAKRQQLIIEKLLEVSGVQIDDLDLEGVKT
jgi:hypothetical protein